MIYYITIQYANGHRMVLVVEPYQAPPSLIELLRHGVVRASVTMQDGTIYEIAQQDAVGQ